MDILKNKHLVTAMLVTPVLAILGYFAVDALVKEKPHPATEGGRYSLLAKSNCRYSSGACDLVNGEMQLRLTAEWPQRDRVLLHLQSEYPLDGALVALVENEAEDAPPVAMQPAGTDGRRWSLELSPVNPEQHQLRMAVALDETLFFGETGLVFSQYDTIFGKDFRDRE